MKTLFFAILSIAISVSAQFCLKAGMSGDSVKEILTHPQSVRRIFFVLIDKSVLGGFVLYGLGAVFWLEVLSKWDVSKAYPLVGLGFVFTVFVGYLNGEQISIARVLGVALICAGVVIVGRT